MKDIAGFVLLQFCFSISAHKFSTLYSVLDSHFPFTLLVLLYLINTNLIEIIVLAPANLE